MNEYITNQMKVDALKWDESVNIGYIVSLLWERDGMEKVSVKKSPLNPQLEETSYIISITFVQDGVVQTTFMGDYLVFSRDSSAVACFPEAYFEDYYSPYEEKQK